MNEETMMPTPPMPSEAPAHESMPAEGEATAGTGPSVTAELRSLGSHLAAALRAATTTDEADALKGDVREGMRQLKDQIDEALAASPIGRKRTGEEAAPSAAESGGAEAGGGDSGGRLSQVRVELAGALRGVNRALDRAAESLEGKGAEPGPTAAETGPQNPPEMMN